MMKLYYFSKSHLSYQPVGWRKISAAVVSLMIVLPVVTAFLGVFGFDLFGLKELCATSVADENAVLRAQLSSLDGQLSKFQQSMDLLKKSDDQLRIAVDMKPIPSDIRKVAVGGVEINRDYGVSSSASRLIAGVKDQLQVLDREAVLQRKSYAEILKGYQKNQVLFQHIPAIDPIRDGVETSPFGMRMHPILHIILMHDGIDIACEVGTHVHATGDGVVSYVGRRGGYGNAVEIDNGFGYMTLFGHLERPLVHDGEKVKRGQVVALSGDTGLSTGPHLHYEVRKNGVPVDPSQYFFDRPEFHTARFYSRIVQN